MVFDCRTRLKIIVNTCCRLYSIITPGKGQIIKTDFRLFRYSDLLLIDRVHGVFRYFLVFLVHGTISESDLEVPRRTYNIRFCALTTTEYLSDGFAVCCPNI